MAGLNFASETELILWVRSRQGLEVRKKLELDRAPLVIETEAGGHFTVYGDRSRVVVKIVERPDVPDRSADLAEEYVGLQLSPYFQDAYWPGNILDRGICRGRKPSELVGKTEARQAYEAIERWGNELDADEGTGRPAAIHEAKAGGKAGKVLGRADRPRLRVWA